MPFLHLKLVLFSFPLFHFIVFFTPNRVVYLPKPPPPLLINAFLDLNLVLFPFPLLHFIVLHPNLVFYFPTAPSLLINAFLHLILSFFPSPFTFYRFLHPNLVFFTFPNLPFNKCFLHLKLAFFPSLLRFIVFYINLVFLFSQTSPPPSNKCLFTS